MTPGACAPGTRRFRSTWAGFGRRTRRTWERHRGTPKAFVTLATGQALWQSRFGRLTAVRVGLPQATVAETLTRAIDPEATGFTVAAVRRSGLDASRGAVDLGEYFLYFSAFLIAAAVLLSASFFRLGVEQRVREVGTLRAVGFPAPTLRRIFLGEGAILLGIGSVVGAAGALAYGGALVAGLRTWWIGAVGTERVYMHASWGALVIGIGVAGAASFGAIAWTLRGLARSSPRALLAGVLRISRDQGRAGPGACRRRGRQLRRGRPGGRGVRSRRDPGVEGFFGAGTLLLVSTLTLTALVFWRDHPRPIRGRGWRALGRLAFRAAAHRPARSLLPVALIASATFIIVSVDAFRKDSRDDWLDRRSGTGGYGLVATSALTVLSDPGTVSGREALGIGAAEAPEIADVAFVSFRQRPGDDASCLNLYAPGEPAVLGAPPAFIADGRFSFSASLPSTAEERRNPWRLLDSDAGNAVIPAIADANSLEYSLHLPVGGETTIRDGRGTPVRVKIVAALRDSILQGALIVSEANFLRMFPAQEGYRFFLLDVPAARAAIVSGALTERLGDLGLRVESSRERLAAYHKVENTYLSTFQSLGTLGLVLGNDRAARRPAAQRARAPRRTRVAARDRLPPGDTGGHGRRGTRAADGLRPRLRDGLGARGHRPGVCRPWRGPARHDRRRAPRRRDRRGPDLVAAGRSSSCCGRRWSPRFDRNEARSRPEFGTHRWGDLSSMERNGSPTKGNVSRVSSGPQIYGQTGVGGHARHSGLEAEEPTSMTHSACRLRLVACGQHGAITRPAQQPRLTAGRLSGRRSLSPPA